jgi:hypothetical protein
VPAAAVQESTLDIVGARCLQDVGAARDGEIHHAPAVLAQCVVDPGCRNAVAVLQRRVEGDTVMGLPKVLEDSTKAGGSAVQPTIGVMVRLTVPPPTALKFATLIGELSSLIG